MKFAPGEVLLRRCWRGGQVSFVQVTRVAADDEQGLRLWLPIGSPYWQLTTAAGGTPRGALSDEPDRPDLEQATWAGHNVMIWMPADEAYSVRWLWDPDGDFAGWYVTFEQPYARWADSGAAGVDTVDHFLALWVSPDRDCQYRGEDEFRARVGHPQYWSAAEAAEVDATASRVRKLAQTGAYPFDGIWRGYRSDPGWTIPGRPAGWHRPRQPRDVQ